MSACQFTYNELSLSYRSEGVPVYSTLRFKGIWTCDGAMLVSETQLDCSHKLED